MARIKLELPKAFPFSTEIAIRISDINYGGHVGNDSVLSIIHEARVQFLMKHGFTEFNVDGAGIIMVDSVVVYKSESFYGEHALVEVAVDDIQKHGCDFFYRITEKESGREIARAKTSILFFNYEKRTLMEVPKKFATLFRKKS